jgi:hypothetical protein
VQPIVKVPPFTNTISGSAGWRGALLRVEKFCATHTLVANRAAARAAKLIVFFMINKKLICFALHHAFGLLSCVLLCFLDGFAEIIIHRFSHLRSTLSGICNAAERG